VVPRRTVVVALAVFLGAVVTGTSRSARAQDSARHFMQSLGDEAIAILADEGLSTAQREEKLGRLFDRGFHLPTVSRFVLGRHWRSATQDQRQEYQQVFRDFIVKSYSKRFSSFAGEQLNITGSRAEGEHDTIVISTIVRPQGKPTRVSWRLRRYADDFKIIDVIVEGVSMLITQRDEFSSVIRKSGGELDGLITLLQDKVESFK
jgi:phospholipid transport system substrate-binding protein